MRSLTPVTSVAETVTIGSFIECYGRDHSSGLWCMVVVSDLCCWILPRSGSYPSIMVLWFKCLCCAK